jgi:hypothetical protein
MPQSAGVVPKLEKKIRERSPAYPAVGLREAVERVKKLIAKDGKAGTSPHLVATHIGFASAHGAAMSVVAALKKFGLIETSGDRLVPTQRAIEIDNLPESDPRRIQAIKDAALSPPIYKELVDQHRESGFPADETLQSELATYKGFNRNAVVGFVKDFKDTLNFAGLSDISELKSEAMKAEQLKEEKKEPFTPVASTLFKGLFPEKEAIRRYPMDISIPRNLRAELLIGGDLRKEDLEKLKRQVERLIENLSDAFED